MIGFTSQQAALFSDLSLRQLNYFDSTHLLSPSVQPAGGRGTRRLYSFRDVVSLRIIAKLRNQGISIQTIRRALTCLHAISQEELSAVVITVTGEDVALVEPDQLAVSLLKQPGQLCFLMDIGGVTHEVERAMRHVG